MKTQLFKVLTCQQPVPDFVYGEASIYVLMNARPLRITGEFQKLVDTYILHLLFLRLLGGSIVELHEKFCEDMEKFGGLADGKVHSGCISKNFVPHDFDLPAKRTRSLIQHTLEMYLYNAYVSVTDKYHGSPLNEDKISLICQDMGVALRHVRLNFTWELFTPDRNQPAVYEMRLSGKFPKSSIDFTVHARTNFETGEYTMVDESDAPAIMERHKHLIPAFEF